MILRVPYGKDGKLEAILTKTASPASSNRTKSNR